MTMQLNGLHLQVDIIMDEVTTATCSNIYITLHIIHVQRTHIVDSCLICCCGGYMQSCMYVCVCDHVHVRGCDLVCVCVHVYMVLSDAVCNFPCVVPLDVVVVI